MKKLVLFVEDEKGNLTYKTDLPVQWDLPSEECKSIHGVDIDKEVVTMIHRQILEKLLDE
jgi:hypothetical protein